MTPATSQSSKTFREQIGPAIWLLALLACSAPANWTGDAPVYIAGSNAVTIDLGQGGAEPSLTQGGGGKLPSFKEWQAKKQGANP